MRVLWITNILLPEMQQYLKAATIPIGGWISASAKELSEIEEVELAVASVSRQTDILVRYQCEGITHYALPYGKGNLTYNSEYEQYWKVIKQEFNPDVVHIFGTEFSHGLAYVSSCGAENVVLSLQGLVSVISQYSAGGLTDKEIKRNLTLRDRLFHTDLLHERNNYIKRGEIEKDLIYSVQHIVGRTRWDKAHSLSINPSATYHCVNETLRTSFYEGVWDYSRCRKHSIFLSQGSSALKGAHWVFRALPYILREFPDTVIRIAGKDITKTEGIKDLMKQTNYIRFVNSLISNLGIGEHVSYLGSLTEEEMKSEYLSANVFVCPSSIENSPNSLAEAQILGVPCVASYAGGIPDFMEGALSKWMYRYDDPVLLAKLVCSTFENRDERELDEMRRIALQRHNRENNRDGLLSVYHRIQRP